MNFKQGIRDGIPIGLGYAAVSFAFGILAVDKDLTVSEAVLISLTNLTSAGQFAGLTIIAAVPLFILSGMLEMENWIRVLLIGMRAASIAMVEEKDGDDRQGARRCVETVYQTCLPLEKSEEVVLIQKIIINLNNETIKIIE